MDMKTTDRKGLIREAYRIEGITYGECRTIFLDWALSLPDGQPPHPAIEHLMQVYGKDAPDHPMTQVMIEGLAVQPSAKRRGGRKARLADDNSPN